MRAFRCRPLPAVANGMPDFHRSMKDSLRTPEQGADTVVWLAVAEAVVKNPSGHFYQGLCHLFGVFVTVTAGVDCLCCLWEYNERTHTHTRLLSEQTLQRECTNPLEAGCHTYLRPHLCLCTDRKMVPTHLPLAWTHSSALEEQKLLSLLEDLAKTFQPHWDPAGAIDTPPRTRGICSPWPRLVRRLCRHAARPSWRSQQAWVFKKFGVLTLPVCCQFNQLTCQEVHFTALKLSKTPFSWAWLLWILSSGVWCYCAV